MSKKFLVLLLVLGFAGVASALPTSDDLEDSVVGDLTGQNGGIGWAGAWSGSDVFDVVAETGNQYISSAYAGTKSMNRNVSFGDDAYSFGFDVRLGSRQDTWGTSTPSEIQLREASGADPVHLKFESSEFLRVGDNWLVDYGAIADAGDASPDALKDLYLDWVNVRVDVDMIANTIKLFWEENDGDMRYIGPGAIQMGSAAVDIANIKLNIRAGGEGKEFELDNLMITAIPEPMTVALLGLGGLGLIRRKR